jgi:Raf kinase inhibitor-like YbhB/YbcL family protein
MKTCRAIGIKGETMMDLTTDIMGLSLTSSAFQNGGMIPRRYTRDGENLSPPLSWEQGPDETRSYVLLVDDSDAPLGSFDHWIVYDIPAEVSSLDEGRPKGDNLPEGGIQGINSSGHIGYDGPAPPPGKPHRYFFRIYAVDEKLNLPPGADKKEVLTKIRNHIVGESEFVGKYGR